MNRDSTKQNGLVCAVDLGGTNLRAATIDSQGRIRERVKKPTPATEEAEEIVSAIAGAVRECDAEGKTPEAQIRAVAVVVPGSVHARTGRVINAPNVRSLQNYELGAALEEDLGRPVLLENDANAAAVGEMWQGAARKCRTLICLTLGTGVGSGIILDGELWRGVDGVAGEIGHTSVEPFAGVRCKCGNTGCLEVYASATAIVRMAGEAVARHSRTSMQADGLSAEKIFRAAREGDQLALDVFRRMGTYLGVTLATVINTFNPEMIVIGGGVAGAWDLFGLRARQEAARRAFPLPAQRCQIVRAECGDDAGILGAARLALEYG